MKLFLKQSIIILLPLTLVFNSCMAKKTKAVAPTCKVVFNFNSIGGGIDYSKYELLSNLLKTKKVAFTEKTMGREGEKEICIPLNELNGKEKTDFIEQLKTLENKDTHVSLSIN